MYCVQVPLKEVETFETLDAAFLRWSLDPTITTLGWTVGDYSLRLVKKTKEKRAYPGYLERRFNELNELYKNGRTGDFCIFMFIDRTEDHLQWMINRAEAFCIPVDQAVSMQMIRAVYPLNRITLEFVHSIVPQHLRPIPVAKVEETSTYSTESEESTTPFFIFV